MNHAYWSPRTWDTVEVEPNTGDFKPMSDIKITVKPNGPLRVEGDLSKIQLADANGNAWDLTGKPGISLCRCGQSAKRPFCDGSHNRVAFQCSASPTTPTA